MTKFIAIGSVLWDIIANASAHMTPGTDIAGRIHRRPGGVALNIAMELTAQGAAVDLLTAIGQDADGEALLSALSMLGTDHVHRSHNPTDSYMAIENPNGDVFGAIADCHSLEAAGTAILAPLSGMVADAVVLDGNLPIETLDHICAHNLIQTRAALVPASPGKAERLKTIFPRLKATLYVNLSEANCLLGDHHRSAQSAAKALFERGALSAVVTDGANVAAQANEDGVFTVEPPAVDATSTTGAGDVFLATHLLADVNGDAPNTALAKAAQAAAKHITKDQL